MPSNPPKAVDCAASIATDAPTGAEQLSASTDGRDSFVRTILRMRPIKGSEQAFEDAVREAMEEISQFPGNLCQHLLRDSADPQTFLIVGDWTDRATLDAFGRSAARERLLSEVRDLRESAERHTYDVLHSVVGGATPKRRPPTDPSA